MEMDCLGSWHIGTQRSGFDNKKLSGLHTVIASCMILTVNRQHYNFLVQVLWTQ